MKWFSCLSTCLLMVSLSSSRASEPVHAQTVYGDDNRLDLFEVTNPLHRKLARSTVAVFSKADLSPATGGGYFIQSSKYGEAFGLCKTERFFEQPAAAFCSGFLVAPDLVATAGHCVMDQEECSYTRIVFGFANQSKRALRGKKSSIDHVREENAYTCREIVAHRFTIRNADFALLRLDRPVEGAEPLALNRSGVIDPKAEFVVMGHPGGIPLKIAAGAKLRKLKDGKSYFMTNTDSFGGNSGSAVFNSETGLVEGILVRGGRDYVKKDGCQVAARCSEGGCRGEAVTKSAQFMEFVSE